MFAIAVMVAEKKLKGLNKDEIKLIKKYRTEETGGRLTLFTNKKRDVSVIADYAHEKFSLRDIGLLANKMAQGKSIGVIRLAPDRDDKTLRETGKFIANIFDVIVVYDKIDGVRRKKFENKKIDLIRKPGEVASIVYQAIKKAQVGDRKVFKQVIENRAVELALSIAEAGDVVVHIVNNDHKKSIEYIKKYLFK
jgi:UDP-N-acetylmuramyl tripeptide synthase